MSLFENDEFQWRETFFIFFCEIDALRSATVESELRKLNPRYEITNVRSNPEGELESLTLFAPDDYAAMDISVVSGDEVGEQMQDLVKELEEFAAPDELDQINRIKQCRRRFDVFHFEQLVFVGRAPEDEDDDFMDPGAVLNVLQKISQLCNGIVVDPQSNTML